MVIQLLWYQINFHQVFLRVISSNYVLSLMNALVHQEEIFKLVY